jgi:hypothetical protein
MHEADDQIKTKGIEAIAEAGTRAFSGKSSTPERVAKEVPDLHFAGLVEILKAAPARELGVIAGLNGPTAEIVRLPVRDLVIDVGLYALKRRRRGIREVLEDIWLVKDAVEWDGISECERTENKARGH